MKKGNLIAALTVASLCGASQVSAVPTYSVIDLGALPGGTASFAFAINSSSQVVGYGNVTDGSSHAFLYDRGVMQDLGTLPGGVTSQAWAINDSGQVVGFSYSLDYPSGDSAFLYDQEGMQDLGASLGYSWSRATAINDLGQIVGYFAGSGAYGAFLYDQGTVQELGACPEIPLRLPLQ